MLSQAPLPGWRQLVRALLRPAPSDGELARPWTREGDAGGWLSRSAWSLALVALWRKRRHPHKELTVWAPDFFCNAALAPLRAVGARLVFYPLNESLEPDIARCKEMAESDPPDLFLLVHYFGDPAPAGPSRDLCECFGAWLIEDSAHVLRPVAGVGTYGDFVLYSPHKHLPLPDCALLVVRTGGAARFTDEEIAGFGAPASWPGQLGDIERAPVHFRVRSSQLQSLIWLAKRLLQKFGIGSGVRATAAFAEPLTAAPGPRIESSHPSTLAKRMLGAAIPDIVNEARRRQAHEMLWDAVLLEENGLGFGAVTVGERSCETDWTPYLATYKVDSAEAGALHARWRQMGMPVVTWPDLPPEVTAHRERHSNAWLLRHARVYLPVHESLNDSDITRFAHGDCHIMEEVTESFKDVMDEKEWSATLASLPTSNTYTSWAWGEYKKRTGWRVSRVIVEASGKSSTIAAFQLQRRKVGPASVLLIQGGIHLRQLSDSNYHDVLRSLISAYLTKSRLAVLMINHQADSSPDVELGMLRAGFTPVLNSRMYTFVIDDSNNAMAGEALSRNWRHNLKRAMKNPLLSARWIESLPERANSLRRLELFYSKLMSRKEFGAAIDFDRARDIIIGTPEFKIVEATLGDEVIATRVGVVCSDHVLDFMAASSEAARNTYANYLLLWKMVEFARNSGKSYFDCGGIDPANDMGVYNFKKGTGGRLALNGPIWLYGSSPMVTKAARALLSLKQ